MSPVNQKLRMMENDQKSVIQASINLQTQMYFWLSLVSTKNNVCELKPGKDFCDVVTFVSPWPIRFHDRIKLKCSLQQ